MPPAEESDCDPRSLRGLGWRQGCLFRLELPLQTVGVDADGKPVSSKDVHPVWAIVEQDCGLAWGAASEQHEPTVEVRPVLTSSPPQDQGIRSAKLDLGEGQYLDSGSSRQMVSPALLVAVDEQARHLRCVSPPVARALKTWLGLRYDRPAVPQTFVATYQELSKRVRKRHHGLRGRVRDVLVAFVQTEDGGVTFDLVALLPAADDLTLDERASLQDWLAELCLDLPTKHGVATGISVATTREVSIDFLEHSYALDTSYVTWPAKGGGPLGAA